MLFAPFFVLRAGCGYNFGSSVGAFAWKCLSLRCEPVSAHRCALHDVNKKMPIPTDPAILLSLVNTRLRDGGESLEAVCAALGATRAEVEAVLSAAGFEYDAQRCRFW